ncbi:MAG: TrkH family potassium uptake protein [Rhodobacteraceae bacterium]|nr:TrkH family potassium uptake protein [Paracoccaceae bacterium]
MALPAGVALFEGNEEAARVFFLSGLLGAIFVTLVTLAISNRLRSHGTAGQLLSLLAAFLFLPAFLALPVWDTMGTTTFLNAYVDMVSALTTTGASMFPEPERLSGPLHLWRAQVGWMGGLLMWVAASAILAPMSLGGFEVTARGALGRAIDVGGPAGSMSDTNMRLVDDIQTIGVIYVSLTGGIWILLLIAGDPTSVALSHAMSVMSTSGISPVGGLENAASGFAGEAILFLFMFFALSRLTFSTDTATDGDGRLDRDPEFRIGLFIILTATTVLFIRHWLAFQSIDLATDVALAPAALWGGLFTVMSYLTTTGFVSADWDAAQSWSGLGTPGLFLMGLALVGGGVATTAGGVKLLRVYALYLNGLREMEKLVHPSSVSGVGGANRRIQRDGALVAWVFFMLFGLSLALTTVALAAFGVGFEDSLVLAVATLSTTGPLIETAAETPIRLVELSTGAKYVISVAMVLGRLETLAIIALLTPNLWRN